MRLLLFVTVLLFEIAGRCLLVLFRWCALLGPKNGTPICDGIDMRSLRGFIVIDSRKSAATREAATRVVGTLSTDIYFIYATCMVV